MVWRAISPKQETLYSSGRLSYTEGNGAWSTIRIKKDVLKEFPMLREKNSKFSYELVLYRSFSQLEKAIKKLRRENGAIPFILSISKKIN